MIVKNAQCAQFCLRVLFDATILGGRIDGCKAREDRRVDGLGKCLVSDEIKGTVLGRTEKMFRSRVFSPDRR
jgi:hypothetical protein